MKKLVADEALSGSNQKLYEGKLKMNVVDYHY